MQTCGKSCDHVCMFRVTLHCRKVPPGYVVVFKGELAHCGAWYEGFHARVHAYCSTPQVSIPTGDQGIETVVYAPGVMEGLNARVADVTAFKTKKEWRNFESMSKMELAQRLQPSPK